MPYINFSDDDLYRANNADLVAFLESRGERVKRVGATFQYIYTDAAGTHDSVTISGGKWYDHKNQRAAVLRSSFCRNFSVFLFKIPCLNCSAGIAVHKLQNHHQSLL